MERERIPSLDEPSGASGELLAAVIRYAPSLPQTEKTAAEWMFWNLGKWVYLLDAWDDLSKDAKSGAYNPFLLSKKDAAGAEFLLNVTRLEAGKSIRPDRLYRAERTYRQHHALRPCRRAEARIR